MSFFPVAAKNCAQLKILCFNIFYQWVIIPAALFWDSRCEKPSVADNTAAITVIIGKGRIIFLVCVCDARVSSVHALCVYGWAALFVKEG